MSKRKDNDSSEGKDRRRKLDRGAVIEALKSELIDVEVESDDCVGVQWTDNS